MNNLSYILNGILTVAVAVLFYLHFSKPGTTAASSGTAAAGPVSIAYIKSDSILKSYDYFKVQRDKLEAKGKQMDSDFRSRAQSLQNEFESYQRNLSNLTIGQAKTIEEDLGKKQQNLRLYQEQLSQNLLNEQNIMNEELYKKVTEYLKVYGEERGLQVVLKFDTSSDLLYGVAALDITQDVIAGLNAAYAREQKEKPAPVDSLKKAKKK
jgi:outer membrane protein